MDGPTTYDQTLLILCGLLGLWTIVASIMFFLIIRQLATLRKVTGLDK